MQRRLRVLHVGKFYPPQMGGMETYLRNLCSELCESVDVEVIVANTGRSAVQERMDGVAVRRLGTLFSVAGAPVCRGMVRQIRDTPADIIHLHHPHPTAFLAYLASGHRGRLVITWHGDIVRQRVLGKMFEPVLEAVLQRSAAVIATSPNYVASSRALSRHAHRCRVIPLGIRTEEFSQSDPVAVAELRRLHGPRIVLGVGRLVDFKGFDYLIRAMALVEGKLLLVGDGPARAALKRTALESGVADRVVFVGNVSKTDEIVPFYRAADVFAFPSVSRNESFGLVQVEAMACGTPVVNTRLDSGVPFVSPHEVSGLTVEPANAEELSRALNLLLDNRELREKYGHAGQDRAQREFSLDRMTQRTLQVYSELVEPVRTPRRGPPRNRSPRNEEFTSTPRPAAATLQCAQGHPA